MTGVTGPRDAGHGTDVSRGSAATGEARAFEFEHVVEVRFRDLDPMDHVHHSLVLVYFEEARAAHWREATTGAGLEGASYIMAELTVRYLERIRYPQALRVALRTSRLGTTSWTLEYELRGAAGQRLASGSSVQVLYDYAAGRPVPIPAALRERLAPA